MTNGQFDIIIIGAGPVGACLALALSSLPLRIAIVEANSLTPTVSIASDSRALALTYGSMQTLSKIGLWPILSHHATPISCVHISDRGHFGMTRIKAEEEQVPALGYVIPAPILLQTLHAALITLTQKSLSGCQSGSFAGHSDATLVKSFITSGEIPQELAQTVLFCPAKVQSIASTSTSWELSLQRNEALEKISGDLIIVADGTHSTTRQLLEIATEVKNLEQSALTTTVTLARHHHNTAYERFLEKSALAMMPLPDLRCGAIWTGPSALMETFMSLSDSDYLAKIQQQFGYRLGRLQAIGKRHIHPLKTLRAKEVTKPGIVLIGNAAHTLHPIAAQGFNLGLADVAALAKVIRQAIHTSLKLRDPVLLNNYLTLRKTSVNWIMNFTNSLMHLFGVNFLPLTLMRNTSLAALNHIPAFKKRLANKLMHS